MTHSYKVNFFHVIWSTRTRLPQLSPEVRAQIHPYLGGVTRDHSGKLLEIGGVADHVHLLIELPSIDKFSDFIRDLKSSSSQLIHKKFPSLRTFAWQEGYASFSLNYSILERVRKYIQNQEQHHATMSFEDEYIKFLTAHNINYDKRFVFG